MTSNTAQPPLDPEKSSPSLFSEGTADRLLEEIRRRPVRSLLIAAGTGYLTGGGLGTRFTAQLLGVSARMALRLAIVPMFVSALERAMSNRTGHTLLPPSDRSNVQKEMHS